MNAPVIRFDAGDQPRIDGVWWVIQQKTPAGLQLYPMADTQKSPRFFGNAELLDLYKAGRLQIMRHGGFKYHDDDQRVLASFSDNARGEMFKRLDYVRACAYFFEHPRKQHIRHKYLKTIALPRPGISDWSAYIAWLKATKETDPVLNRTSIGKVGGFWRISQIITRYHRMKNRFNGQNTPPLNDEQVGASTLRTWYRTWDHCNRQETSLLPAHHRKGGGNQLDPRVTSIIAATVRNRWLKLERPPVSAIHYLVEEEDRRKKGDPDWTEVEIPSRMAIHRWIKRNVSEWEELSRRDGRDVARYKLKPLGTVQEPDRPLQIVEMDHTQLDVMLIIDPDPHSPRRKGKTPETRRAWLTVAIDVATRMILGFHLDFAAPSWASVSEALKMGIREKLITPDDGIESSWPAMGVPEILRLDNGAEFHSDSMKASAAELHMELRYCPPGRPHLKGRVERFFKDVADDYCAMLPGRTFTIKTKGDYPSEDLAVMSLRDAQRLFKKWVVDIYHRSEHSGLGGKSPLTRWQELAHHGVRLPPSVDELNFALGQSYYRTIDPRGIRIFGLHYHSDDVASLPKRINARKDRRYEVRLDPADLSKILVLDPVEYKWLEAELREDWLAKGLDLASWLSLCEQARDTLRPGQKLDREVMLRARRDYANIIDGIISKNGRRRLDPVAAETYEDQEIPDSHNDPDPSQSAGTVTAPKQPLPLGPNASPFAL